MGVAPDEATLILNAITTLQEATETNRKENREDHQQIFDRLNSLEKANANTISRDDCDKCKEKAQQQATEKQTAHETSNTNKWSLGIAAAAVVISAAGIIVPLLIK